MAVESSAAVAADYSDLSCTDARGEISSDTAQLRADTDILLT